MEIEELRKNIPALPDYDGMTVQSAEEGHVVCSFSAPESFANYHGMTHGGFIYGICEIVAGMTCTTCGADNVALAGNINYLRQCPLGEELRIEGTTDHNGRRTKVHRIVITNAETGKTIAETTFTMFVL